MGRRLGWGENITGKEKNACVVPELERTSTSLKNREKSKPFWNYCNLSISSGYNFVEFYFTYSICRKHFFKINYYIESDFSNDILTLLSKGILLDIVEDLKRLFQG